MSLQRIAVLVTAHNRKLKTLNCLSCLFECQLPIGFEINVFLVDDGSSDSTATAVLQNFPNVNIIHGNGQLFWNRGMHLAWETAAKQDFDFYLWLNDDTFLYDFAVSLMLKTSLENNHQSIVCGAVCAEDQSFSYGLHTMKGEPILPGSADLKGQLMNGNCVLIPKAVFEKNGNLDSRFPHAIGDFDYGLRAIRKGISIFTTTAFLGECSKNASLPKWCYNTIPLLQRLKALYSPLGNAHPIYFFIYEKRHFGFILAIKHFLSIHLRVMFPSLWK